MLPSRSQSATFEFCGGIFLSIICFILVWNCCSLRMLKTALMLISLTYLDLQSLIFPSIWAPFFPSGLLSTSNCWWKLFFWKTIGLVAYMGFMTQREYLNLPITLSSWSWKSFLCKTSGWSCLYRVLNRNFLPWNRNRLGLFSFHRNFTLEFVKNYILLWFVMILVKLNVFSTTSVLFFFVSVPTDSGFFGKKTTWWNNVSLCSLYPGFDRRKMAKNAIGLDEYRYSTSHLP